MVTSSSRAPPNAPARRNRETDRRSATVPVRPGPGQQGRRVPFPDPAVPVLPPAGGPAGTLTVTATDLSVALRVPVPASVTEPGAVVVPARLLCDFVGSLPKGVPVSLESDDKTFAGRW